MCVTGRDAYTAVSTASLSLAAQAVAEEASLLGKGANTHPAVVADVCSDARKARNERMPHLVEYGQLPVATQVMQGMQRYLTASGMRPAFCLGRYITGEAGQNGRHQRRTANHVNQLCIAFERGWLERSGEKVGPTASGIASLPRREGIHCGEKTRKS